MRSLGEMAGGFLVSISDTVLPAVPAQAGAAAGFLHFWPVLGVILGVSSVCLVASWLLTHGLDSMVNHRRHRG